MLRFFPKEAWRQYACLLIIFFALAAFAVWNTLEFINQHLAGDAFTNAAVRIWGITFGFMFITGAFGLWAIQFSAEIESLRIVGRLVDSMDYLRDGLIALDKRGRITGSNPTISSIAEVELSYNSQLSDIFPCLSNDDIELFINNEIPQEIEREFVKNGSARILRFRSQPSEGLVLILVSDVTYMTTQQMHRRQATQLQLIGQIAKGVAHDFNNLLCVISGHASLLKRLPSDSPDFTNSIADIITNAERGTSLAGHLMQLTREGSTGQPTNMSLEYVNNATKLLTESISQDWKVESNLQPMPIVPLTGIQIEQVVLNLGMLAADTVSEPGIITISAGSASKLRGSKKDDKYAAMIRVTAAGPISSQQGAAVINIGEIESGVILSVVQSMLDEAGCRLKHTINEDGEFEFEVLLPASTIQPEENESAELSRELEAYISDWTVLLGTPTESKNTLPKRLKEVGISSIIVDNISSTLAHIEEDAELDAIILDESLLSQEVRGLLKAIIRIRPKAAIVVLCDSLDSAIFELVTNVVFDLKTSSPNKILTSMIEAKNLALRRH